ncbi:MutS-related protein [Zunongwangia atlantica]|uniref:Mismatch repair protein MutS-like ATPase n=1 Tax=Zunongwangia atlantica 22II14-10F7 TaxID=1185767 RepID=A0A1Y1T4K5_9FLAO|nr:DNA mismatch repair protein MutS [Zunongwangia atlantica]ORL45977.1 Mismatch repair protein MutS-like ATPase [Zunongwangia atlantica 22II14-10F7]
MQLYSYLAIIGIVLYLLFRLLKKRSAKRHFEELKNNWAKAKTEKFNFDQIKSYYAAQLHLGDFHQINDQSAKDLDFSALFAFLDRTTSKPGQQYFYNHLRNINTENQLKRFSTFSDTFLEAENERLKIQSQLSKLNHYNAYDFVRLITDEPMKRPKWIVWVYILSFLSIFSLLGGFFYPVLFLIMLPVFMTNMVLHYRNKNNLNYYLNAVHQLSIAIKAGNKISNFGNIRTYFKDLSFLGSVRKIQFKTSLIGFENKMNDEFAFFGWFFFEVLKITFNIEILLFFNFLEDIQHKRNDIEKLFRFLGEIDTAIAVASIKTEYQDRICQPYFSNKKEIRFSEIRHPLIKDCVTNNLDLSEKSMLLTGSNMSGKSTFIRTVAINTLLAQTLNICFAEDFTAPFLKLYSSIRITDNLSKNTSYYLEEVLQIKKLLDFSKEDTPKLFVLDEIFKGTNTEERIAAGKSILSYLNTTQNIVMVSTHDIELTEMLTQNDFDLYHFSESIQNQELNFNHKLKKGPLKTKNAIKILALYDFPKQIITEAEMLKNKPN